MGVKKLALNSARDEDRAEQSAQEISLPSRDEVTEGRGVRNNHHQKAVLPRAIWEFLEHVGLAVKLGGVVIVEINILGKEILSLYTGEA